jgi:hypothetical protein
LAHLCVNAAAFRSYLGIAAFHLADYGGNLRKGKSLCFQAAKSTAYVLVDAKIVF